MWSMKMNKKDEYTEVAKMAAEAMANELAPYMQELKTKNQMLERENEFLRKLVENMSAPVANPDTFKVPQTPYTPYPWERSYGPVTDLNKCSVCGLSGTNGLVCYNQKCPTKASC